MGIALSAGSTAFASSYLWQAPTDCAPETNATGALTYDSTGAWVIGGLSNQSVDCSLHWAGNYTALDTADPLVYYTDNNSGQNFACYSTAISTTGTVYTGTTKYSCAFAGGCTTGAPSFTGSSTLELGAVTTGGKASYSVHCVIPASTTSGYSRIFGYTVFM